MKLKMSRDRVEAFITQNYNLINIYENTKDEHEMLLREFMIDMHVRLNTMLATRETNNFTISLSNAEAMAFYQIWQKVDLRHCPYSQVIVADAVTKIDKFHKSAQAKARYAKPSY